MCLGLPELKSDPRFQETGHAEEEPQGADAAARGQTEGAGRPLSGLRRSTPEGVPSGEILSLEAALDAPQIGHRNTIRTVREDRIGDLKLFSLTAHFEKTPGSSPRRLPGFRLTPARSWRAWGTVREEIADLRAKGVV